MILGALLIGLLTAYYFGIKPGIIAAGSSALLFLIAAIVPGTSIPIYGLIALAVVGICVVGPRMSPSANEEGRNSLRRWGRRVIGKLWRRL